MVSINIVVLWDVMLCVLCIRFNKAVSLSDCVALNFRMISKL
jgi:biopolymer transport protein ExbD